MSIRCSVKTFFTLGGFSQRQIIIGDSISLVLGLKEKGCNMRSAKDKKWLPLLLGMLIFFSLQPEVYPQTSSPQKTMPNVVGLPFPEAARRIISLGLLVKIPPEQVESNDPNLNDKVVQQNPTVGQPYPATKNVILKVYKFSNRLPDVMGLPIEEAKRRMEAIGLKVSFNDPHKTGDKTQDGKVAFQYPPAGGPFPPSRAVALAQYKYDAATMQTKVPNVIGLRLQDAQNVLAQAGLHYHVFVHQQSKDKNQADKIFVQSPNSGSSVARNTTVILSQYVYSPDDKVTVPNVVGLRVDKALEVLKGSGFVSKHYVASPRGNDLLPSFYSINKVISQDYAAGRIVNPIYSLRLGTIYEGGVPNVVGLKYEDACNVLISCGMYFEPKFEKPPGGMQPPPQKGLVFFQDPRPGEPLPKKPNLFKFKYYWWN